MSTPSPALTGDFRNIHGDILILGVGGKMVPTLARLASRAVPDRRVIVVARFSESGLSAKNWSLGELSASPPTCWKREAIEAPLPKVRNVLFMAGRKFGTTGREV